MNNKKYDGVYYPVRKIRDLRDIIISSAELKPDHPAYMVKDRPGGTFRPITFGQLREDMDALGTKLISLGLKDKKIAVIGATSYHWLLSYFATVCGVGVIVPLDKNLPEGEIANLLERSGAEALVFDKSSRKKLDSIMENPGNVKYFISTSAVSGASKEDKEGNEIYHIKELIEDGKSLVQDGIRDYVDAYIDNEKMCSLLFTSGTTGKSKGVMLSHRNIASNVYHMSKLVQIPGDGVVLSILPVHHVYEMTCTIWTCLYQGITVGISEGLKYIQKNLVELSAVTTLGVPLIFEKMYRAIWRQAEGRGEADKLRKAIDLSRRLKLYDKPFIMKKMFKPIHKVLGGNIYMLIAGGAAIDPKVIEDFEAMGIPMIQGYGMTENAPIIAVNQDRYSKAASVGKPMPETEVEIVDKDEFGVGEIVVKGPSVMIGYYEDHEATDEVLKDGWLYTGDYGYFDEEGFLYITGRKKNVIVTKGGKNIFPEEVETVILENPYVEEVLVHGVTDDRLGNIVLTADIYPSFSLLKEDKGEMTESDTYYFFKEYMDKVNQLLPPYKHIKRINIRHEEFEKTTTGKIKRFVAGNIIEDSKGGPVSKENVKALERKIAEEKVKAMVESKDSRIKHRNMRPIVSIKQMVESSAAKFPDNVAFYEKFTHGRPYSEITYKQLLSDINGLGTALINRGMKNERIAIIGRNSYNWALSFLSVVGGVGAVVPLDKDMEPDDLEQLIKKAGAKAVFADKENMAGAKELLAKEDCPLEMVISLERRQEEAVEDTVFIGDLVKEGKEQIAHGDRQFIDADIDASKLAVILFTWGRHEAKKGVMLSNTNITDNLMSVSALAEVRADDMFFSVLPMHRPYELTCGMLLPLYRGAAVAFCKDMKHIMENLQEIKPTIFLGVPWMLEAFYKRAMEKMELKKDTLKVKGLLGANKITKVFGFDLSRQIAKDIHDEVGGRMRAFVSGGGPIDHKFLSFIYGLGIVAFQGYGLPECSPIVSLTPDGFKNFKGGSAGQLIPGMDIQIEKPDEKGVGEIVLRGENVMLGYLDDPQATSEVIIDGWLHTRDLGYVDKDGFIYLKGRMKKEN